MASGKILVLAKLKTCLHQHLLLVAHHSVLFGIVKLFGKVGNVWQSQFLVSCFLVKLLHYGFAQNLCPELPMARPFVSSQKMDNRCFSVYLTGVKIFWDIKYHWFFLLSTTPPWLPCLANSCCCLVTKSCLTLWQFHALWSSRLLCPWDFPGKNTGARCHFLL